MLYARKKKVAVLTSLHISIMITIALTLVSTLTSFTDLIKFVNGSRQTAIKYLTYLCLILPLIIAFLTQPSFIRSLTTKGKSNSDRAARNM